MPTPAQITAIQTALAATAAAPITAAQMVALLDYHIAAAVEKGQLRVSYQANGRSVTMSLDQAINARTTYQKLADAQSAKDTPVVPMMVDMA